MKRAIYLAIMALLVSAPMVLADDPPNTLRDGVSRAADLQLARQGTYANGDLGSGTYDCAWEWIIGSGSAYRNTQAPSALGLLEAYEATGKVKYLTSGSEGAVCAANQMIARYEADTSRRPFAQDLIFLAELSELTHNRGYLDLARTYHARTRAAYPTGGALADHYIDVRQSLGGWDLSAEILGAVAVEQDDYAKDIALQLIARRADWEGVLYGGYDYSLLSHGWLVAALDGMSGNTIKAYRKEIAASVLAAQDTDGSWDHGSFQTTAYVLMGLETLSRSHDVRHAIKGGANFLLSTETAAGGWSYPPEFGEDNGEVLSALAPLLRNRGHDDDCGEEFEGPHEHGDRDSHERARPHRDND